MSEQAEPPLLIASVQIRSRRHRGFRLLYSSVAPPREGEGLACVCFGAVCPMPDGLAVLKGAELYIMVKKNLET